MSFSCSSNSDWRLSKVFLKLADFNDFPSAPLYEVVEENWRRWEAEWTRLVRHQIQHHLPPSKDIRPSPPSTPPIAVYSQQITYARFLVIQEDKKPFLLCNLHQIWGNICDLCSVQYPPELSRLETYWRPREVRQLVFMCNNPASPFQTEYSAKDCLLWSCTINVRLEWLFAPILT